MIVVSRLTSSCSGPWEIKCQGTYGGVRPLNCGVSRHMTIVVTREFLATHLRTYGEDALAQRVLSVSDDVMKDIGERAHGLLPPSGLLALGLVRAVIVVLEGELRAPRWKRRQLKGIYPGM